MKHINATSLLLGISAQEDSEVSGLHPSIKSFNGFTRETDSLDWFCCQQI